jgi:hypothetical protein
VLRDDEVWEMSYADEEMEKGGNGPSATVCEKRPFTKIECLYLLLLEFFASLYRPAGAESMAEKCIVPSMYSRSNRFAHSLERQRATFLACMVSGHQLVASLSTLRRCFWYEYGTTSTRFLHSAPRQGPGGTSHLRRSACP